MKNEAKAIPFERRLATVYGEAFSILCERQRKYGPSNILEAGIYGVLDQSRNKIERAQAQLSGRVERGRIRLDEMDEETRAVFRDSVLDLANYAIITVALLDGRWDSEMRMAPRGAYLAIKEEA
jgi:hypothetical protein